MIAIDSVNKKTPYIPIGDFQHSSFAGPCFDAEGKYLYVNIENPGLTLAITGPWERGWL